MDNVLIWENYQNSKETIDSQYFQLINNYTKAYSSYKKEEAKEIENRIKKLVSDHRTEKGYNIYPVYHGSGFKNGRFFEFKPTSSYRDSGFMGHNDAVTSPVWFFSATPEMAHSFAVNRSDDPRSSWVHSRLSLKIQKPLDLTNTDYKKILAKIGIKFNGSKSYAWTLFDDHSNVEKINSAGYDGALIDESVAANTFKLKSSSENPHNKTYIVFNSNQIKFGTEIVKDDRGNIIPLSKRFDESSNDIRF